MDSRNKIFSSLTGLVRSIEGNEDLISQDTIRMIQDSLVTIGQGEADENVTQYLVSVLEKEKHRLAPDCATCMNHCGRTDNWNPDNLDSCSEEVRELKLQLISLSIRLAKEKKNIMLIIRMIYAVGQDAVTKGFLKMLAEEAASELSAVS